MESNESMAMEPPWPWGNGHGASHGHGHLLLGLFRLGSHQSRFTPAKLVPFIFQMRGIVDLFFTFQVSRVLLVLIAWRLRAKGQRRHRRRPQNYRKMSSTRWRNNPRKVPNDPGNDPQTPPGSRHDDPHMAPKFLFGGTETCLEWSGRIS